MARAAAKKSWRSHSLAWFVAHADVVVPGLAVRGVEVAGRGEPAAREAMTAFMEKRKPDFSNC